MNNDEQINISLFDLCASGFVKTSWFKYIGSNMDLELINVESIGLMLIYGWRPPTSPFVIEGGTVAWRKFRGLRGMIFDHPIAWSAKMPSIEQHYELKHHRLNIQSPQSHQSFIYNVLSIYLILWVHLKSINITTSREKDHTFTHSLTLFKFLSLWI